MKINYIKIENNKGWRVFMDSTSRDKYVLNETHWEEGKTLIEACKKMIEYLGNQLLKLQNERN